MSPRASAVRLTIYLTEGDRHRHRPLYAELVHRAQRAGLAGASVFRGIEGYGTSSHIHTGRMLAVSEDLPLIVVMVDARERIEAFLAEMDELLAGRLVTVESVEAHRFPDGGDRP